MAKKAGGENAEKGKDRQTQDHQPQGRAVVIGGKQALRRQKGRACGAALPFLIMQLPDLGQLFVLSAWTQTENRAEWRR